MQHRIDQIYDPRHLIFLQTTGRDRRRTETQTRSLEGRTAVERHHVLIGRYIGADQSLLGYLARQLGELGTQVNEHRVVIRTAGDDLIALLHERLRHDGCVGLDLPLIHLEVLRQGLAERNGFGGDDMLQRAALRSGEHGAVEQRAHLLDLALRRCLAPRVVKILAHEDHAATRTTERLMGR